MNLQKMMKQAQAMQSKMEEAQAKIAELEVEGSAGGGMVSITINGKGEAKKVAVDPKIVDPSDVEMLEDLIVAAINDANAKKDVKAAEEMQKVTSGMSLPPGVKLPF